MVLITRLWNHENQQILEQDPDGKLKTVENPYKTIKKDKMKRTIQEDKEFITIEDGLHNGVIIEVQERKKPYEYVDLIISVDELKNDKGEQITLKAGFPDFISPSSLLGKFISNMGIEGSPGDELDLDLLRGVPVSYQTVQEEVFNKKGEKKIYSNILRETIKRREIV